MQAEQSKPMSLSDRWNNWHYWIHLQWFFLIWNLLAILIDAAMVYDGMAAGYILLPIAILTELLTILNIWLHYRD